MPNATTERHARRDQVLQAVAGFGDAEASDVASPPRRDLAVAVAASARVREGLAPEWHQTELDSVGWRAQLDGIAAAPAALLLEVRARGVVPGWSAASQKELVAWAQDAGVTVWVWVTAGTDAPDAVGRLGDAAAVIFVADTDAVEVWRARWPQARVEVLLPAVQPRHHSPAHGGPALRRDGQAAVVVDEDGAATSSLAGLDALVTPMTRLKTSPDLDVWYLGAATPSLPEELRDLLVPGGPGSDAGSAVDHYRVLVDAGRGAAESTWSMLAAAAAQTSVVTLPEQAKNLPADLAPHVATATDPTDFRRQITARVNQLEVRDRETLAMHRAVLAGHTFAHRADRMLEVAGRPSSAASRSVSVIVPTNRAHEIDNVLDNVGRQLEAQVELILVLHGLDVDEADLRVRAAERGVEALTVIRADASEPLGALMNHGIDAADGAYLAKMDDDNFYGRHYLGDLVNAFAYTDAGIVGKWAHYVWLRSTNAVVARFERHEHRYNRLVQGGSILVGRDLARDLRFSNIPRAVDSDFLNRAQAAGIKTYSSDRFNFVSIRGTDRGAHTWKITDVEMMVGAGRVVFFGDPRDHVDV